MIAPSVVTQIEQLLAEGNLSQRKISKMTGVSRGTIGAIANGKRPDLSKPRKPWDEQYEEPAGPPQRCPSCGATVYLPCRLCRVRRLVAAGRIPPQPNRPDEPLQLKLTDDHRARYEQVRARRIDQQRHLEESHPVLAEEEETWDR